MPKSLIDRMLQWITLVNVVLLLLCLSQLVSGQGTAPSGHIAFRAFTKSALFSTTKSFGSKVATQLGCLTSQVVVTARYAPNSYAYFDFYFVAATGARLEFKQAALSEVQALPLPSGISMPSDDGLLYPQADKVSQTIDEEAFPLPPPPIMYVAEVPNVRGMEAASGSASSSASGSDVTEEPQPLAYTDLEYLMGAMLPQYLFDDYGIEQLWTSDTSPKGNTVADTSQWYYALRVDTAQAAAVGKAFHIGRLDVQAGVGAIWGSACSIGMTDAIALSICQKIDPSATAATYFPYASTTNAGLIAITPGVDNIALGNLTTKTTACVHGTDVGLVCGTDTVTVSSYDHIAEVTKADYSSAADFLAKLSSATNVPIGCLNITSETDYGTTVGLTISVIAAKSPFTLADTSAMLSLSGAWGLKVLTSVTTFYQTDDLLPYQYNASVVPTAGPTTTSTTTTTTAPTTSTTRTTTASTTTTTGTTTSTTTTTTTPGLSSTTQLPTNSVTPQTITASAAQPTTTTSYPTDGTVTSLSSVPPTTSATPSTTESATTASSAPPTSTTSARVVVDFTVDSSVTTYSLSITLRSYLNTQDYNDLTVVGCNSSSTNASQRVCAVDFINGTLAQRAIDAANDQQLSNVLSAAEVDNVPNGDGPKSDDNGTRDAVIIAVVIIVVVALAIGIGLFVLKSRRRSGKFDEDTVTHYDHNDMSERLNAIEDDGMI